MTVCLGALCEHGKSAVVAADKMVTFGPPMNLLAEPASLSKIVKMGENTLLLFSGSVPDGEEIMSNGIAALGGAGMPSIAAAGDKIKTAYEVLKRKRAEETILKPLIGADFAQFQTMLTQTSASQILGQVLGMCMQHNLQLDLLLAGVDGSGAHLFIVTHPGVLMPMDTIGFASIGSGGTHAGVGLSLSQQTQETPLWQTVYNVYEAKRAAEVAPGVGKLTDLAIITDKKTVFASPALVEALEAAHKEKTKLTDNELEQLKASVDGCLNGQ